MAADRRLHGVSATDAERFWDERAREHARAPPRSIPDSPTSGGCTGTAAASPASATPPSTAACPTWSSSTFPIPPSRSPTSRRWGACSAPVAGRRSRSRRTRPYTACLARPREQEHPAWLGSAVSLSELARVADGAGRALERVLAAGSQFTTLLARRR